MSATQSLSMIVPDAQKQAADAFFAGLGWGSPTFSAPLAETEEGPATHWGCHIWQTPEFVAVLNASIASAAPDLAVLDDIFFHIVTGGAPWQNFAAALALSGLVRVVPPEDEE